MFPQHQTWEGDAAPRPPGPAWGREDQKSHSREPLAAADLSAQQEGALGR